MGTTSLKRSKHAEVPCCPGCRGPRRGDVREGPVDLVQGLPREEVLREGEHPQVQHLECQQEDGGGTEPTPRLTTPMRPGTASAGPSPTPSLPPTAAPRGCPTPSPPWSPPWPRSATPSPSPSTWVPPSSTTAVASSVTLSASTDSSTTVSSLSAMTMAPTGSSRTPGVAAGERVATSG